MPRKPEVTPETAGRVWSELSRAQRAGIGQTMRDLGEAVERWPRVEWLARNARNAAALRRVRRLLNAGASRNDAITAAAVALELDPDSIAAMRKRAVRDARVLKAPDSRAA